jgi:cell division protein FtsL
MSKETPKTLLARMDKKTYLLLMVMALAVLSLFVVIVMAINSKITSLKERIIQKELEKERLKKK